MKHFLDLIPISAKVHRKQNRMSILCIILSVFLVTTIFGMADMFIRSQILQAQRDDGSWHIGLRNISAENAALMTARPDIAVISLGGVVESASIKVAGDQFNEAVVKYMRRKHNILVGEGTAEKMKIAIGCVYPKEEETFMDVKGRCLLTGLPKTITVSSAEMLEAFAAPTESILESIHAVLERTPPELVADVSTNGIMMTGGGSLVAGFDKLITSRTGIATSVAENAIACVAEGTGKSLDMITDMQEGTINLSRRRQVN